MATVCGVRCVRCVWRRSGLAKVAWDMATAPCGCVLLDFVAESAEHRELHFIKYKDIVFSMGGFQRANTRVYAYLIYLCDALISYLSERSSVVRCFAVLQTTAASGASAFQHFITGVCGSRTLEPRAHAPTARGLSAFRSPSDMKRQLFLRSRWASFLRLRLTR